MNKELKKTIEYMAVPVAAIGTIMGVDEILNQYDINGASRMIGNVLTSCAIGVAYLKNSSSNSREETSKLNRIIEEPTESNNASQNMANSLGEHYTWLMNLQGKQE
ncbi:hypothetical protein HN865_04885 [Candidatus Woesearchaeota archaeon]|jgi:hypothetical protein|nr:hypothetical protein [Candidatus Woesearchaeota archaeon]MBT7238159.1 hypothetical protein [Candidatus Woesearchaeota archaeon]